MFFTVEDLMLSKVLIRASSVVAVREGSGSRTGHTHIILSTGDCVTTDEDYKIVCLMVEHGYESPI